LEINEWYLANEINVNGIIFWMEKKIIIQSIYREIMRNRKCIGGRPSFDVNLIIMIIEIKSVFVLDN